MFEKFKKKDDFEDVKLVPDDNPFNDFDASNIQSNPNERFEGVNIMGETLKGNVGINPSALVGKSLEGADLSHIDTENYPHNIPDKTTCEILDELLAENKLTFREVKYCFGDNEISLTEPYKEYSFDGRKFVRVEVKNDNNPDLNIGEYSWIEVQPISEKTYFVGMTQEENGRSR